MRLDALHDHPPGVVIHHREQQGHNGGAETRHRVALAQVLPQDFNQPLHDVILAHRLHNGTVHGRNHDHPQEHGGAQAFQIAHLQVEDFLEHHVFADEGAPAFVALPQLVADGFQVQIKGFAGIDNLRVELLHVVAGTHTQIMIIKVGDILVLEHGLVVALGLDQGVHQLHVQPVVQVVHFQGLAAHGDHAVIVLVLLEAVQIAVHRGQITVVQGGGHGKRPVALLAVQQQIAGEQVQQLLHQLPAGGLVQRVLLQLVEDVLNLVNVHLHAGHALPPVGAALGHNAAAKAVIHLIEQRTHAADQGFEGLLGVAALFLRPQGAHELEVGNRFSPVHDQNLHQRRALAGFFDQMIHLFFINIDHKVVHQLNLNLVKHNAPPYIGSRLRRASGFTAYRIAVSLAMRLSRHRRKSSLSMDSMVCSALPV